MGSNDDRVRLSLNGGVATLTLDRASCLNALDVPMHRALAAALDRIAHEPAIRAVILTGSGRAFCAGQDLGERAAAFHAGTVPDIDASLRDHYNPLIRRLASLPMPVIAAVNGIAFGAGAAIAAACDIAVAARSARFQFAFVTIGLGPDSGASWTLPRLIGLQKAMDLALTGRTVDADEAERIGLVARCVDDDALAATVRGLADGFAAAPQAALAMIKARLRGALALPLDTALEREREAQAALSRTDIYRAAVLRFAARTRGPITGTDVCQT